MSSYYDGVFGNGMDGDSPFSSVDSSNQISSMIDPYGDPPSSLDGKDVAIFVLSLTVVILLLKK
jgi:hypothetical protein